MHEVIDYENLTLEDFYAKQEPILAKLIKNRPNGRQFCFWSHDWDLNPGPLPYHGSALPLSYRGVFCATAQILYQM